MFEGSIPCPLSHLFLCKLFKDAERGGAAEANLILTIITANK